jgi:hypothetical protein
MSFWLAFGIAEEFEDGGQGTSVTVLHNHFASFDDAANSLVDTDVPVVGGRVAEANAYVVEADTTERASSLVRTAVMEQRSSSHVQLVQQDIRTRQMPKESPEIEALNRLYGELCITHQLTRLALTRVKRDEHRERLEQHTAVLEEFGYAVLVMRGGTEHSEASDVPTGAQARSGSERLGYRDGQIEGAESAGFAGALGSLAGELNIARRQAALAKQVVSPSHEKGLDDLSIELDRFGVTVTELQDEVRTPRVAKGTQ